MATNAFEKNQLFSFDVLIQHESIIGAGSGTNIHEHTPITDTKPWKCITNSSFTHAGYLNEYTTIKGMADKSIMITSRPPRSFTIEKLMTDTKILEHLFQPNLLRPTGDYIPQPEGYLPSFAISIISDDSYIEYFGCTITEYSINISPDYKYITESITFQPHYARTGDIQSLPTIDYSDTQITVIPMYDCIDSENDIVMTSFSIKFKLDYNTNRLNPHGWVSYLCDVNVYVNASVIPNRFTESVEILLSNEPRNFVNVGLKLPEYGKRLMIRKFHQKVSESVQRGNYAEIDLECNWQKGSSVILENYNP